MEPRLPLETFQALESVPGRRLRVQALNRSKWRGVADKAEEAYPMDARYEGLHSCTFRKHSEGVLSVKSGRTPRRLFSLPTIEAVRTFSHLESEREIVRYWSFST